MTKHIEPDDAVRAATNLLEGIACFANEYFDAEAGERLLNPLGTPGKEGTLRNPEMSQLIPLVRDLAVFAWEGTWCSNVDSLLDAFSESGPLRELVYGQPKITFGGDVYSVEDGTLLETMMDAAWTRYQMHDGSEINFQQLAALARVAEKTVRMAANPKLNNALRTASGSGNRTYIRAEDALAWLRQRKDFRETRFDVRIDEEQQAIRSPADLAQMCTQFRKKAKLTVPQLRKKLGWTARGALAYQNMEGGLLDEASEAFTPAGLVKLARALGVPDTHKFAQDAVQVIVTEKAKSDIARKMAELERS